MAAKSPVPRKSSPVGFATGTVYYLPPMILPVRNDRTVRYFRASPDQPALLQGVVAYHDFTHCAELIASNPDPPVSSPARLSSPLSCRSPPAMAALRRLPPSLFPLRPPLCYAGRKPARPLLRIRPCESIEGLLLTENVAAYKLFLRVFRGRPSRWSCGRLPGSWGSTLDAWGRRGR